MSDDNKKIILTISNVRIKEYDRLNLAIERLEAVYNPITKETNDKWRFKGYSSTVLKALLFIQDKELLINQNADSDLKSYLKQVQDSNKKILNALEEINHV